MDCVLCDILVADENSQLLYRDAHVFVVLNIEPVKDGHLMVLPVRHVKDLADLDQGEAAAFLAACDRAMRILEKMYDGEGPMCMVNGWQHRSQEHLHAHVLPSKSSLRKLYSVTEGTPLRIRLELEALQAKSKQMRPHFG